MTSPSGSVAQISAVHSTAKLEAVNTPPEEEESKGSVPKAVGADVMEGARVVDARVGEETEC